MSPVCRYYYGSGVMAHEQTIGQEEGGIETSDAFMFGLDRLGFDFMGKEKTSGDWVEFRMPWERTIDNVDEVKTVVAQILKSKSKE
jgi:hypothetical protein